MDNDDNKEGFINYNRDLALKALLFGMVFYILVSPYVILNIKKLILPTIEFELIQSILFTILNLAIKQ